MPLCFVPQRAAEASREQREVVSQPKAGPVEAGHGPALKVGARIGAHSPISDPRPPAPGHCRLPTHVLRSLNREEPRQAFRLKCPFCSGFPSDSLERQGEWHREVLK